MCLCVVCLCVCGQNFARRPSAGCVLKNPLRGFLKRFCTYHSPQKPKIFVFMSEFDVLAKIVCQFTYFFQIPEGDFC